MLEVRVYAGHSLPVQHPYGLYHPTVSVQVGSHPHMYTTPIAVPQGQPKNSNPEFNQLFYFPVQWPVTNPQEYLFVRVHDLSPQGQVQTLGFVWFALKDFDPNRSAEAWFPLLESRGSGTLRIGMVPHPKPLTQLQYPTGPFPIQPAVPKPATAPMNPYAPQGSPVVHRDSNPPAPVAQQSPLGASGGVARPSGHQHVPSNGGGSPMLGRPNNPAPAAAPAAVPKPLPTPPASSGGGKSPASTPDPYATVLFRPSAAEVVAPKKQLKLYMPNEIQRTQPPLANWLMKRFRGSFGVVYVGTVSDRPGVKVVIKDQEVRDARSIEDWQHEIEIMHNNRHPHIADIYGFGRVNNALIIVMEYFPKGDLFSVLHKHADKHPLSRLQRMRMARHVALGLAFLHDNGIMHRDIKSLNVLVGDDYSCKITDFGTAKLLGSGGIQHQIQQQTKGVGSPLWMAPEVSKSSSYSFPGDIYSLGVLLYEIFERAIPYDAKAGKVTFPDTYASSVIVRPCIDPEPAKRPKAKDVLRFVDLSIKQTLAAVARVLPQADQNTLAAQLDQLKAQRDANIRSGKIPAMNDQKLQEEEVSDILQTMYLHMLSKPPKEVDDLILKSVQK